MAGPETGLQWLFAVDTAESEGSPVWVDLPQQLDGDITFSKSDIDTTNKENSGWEDGVSNRRGWTASASGIGDDNDLALQYLLDTNTLHATATDKPVHVKLTNAAGDTLTGWATMENHGITFPETDVVKYSLSLKGRSRDNTGASAPIALVRA